MATPHKTVWVKSTPYGDYRDVNQNHKQFPNDEHYNLVRFARKYGINHPGSKSMKVLRAFFKQ